MLSQIYQWLVTQIQAHEPVLLLNLDIYQQVESYVKDGISGRRGQQEGEWMRRQQHLDGKMGKVGKVWMDSRKDFCLGYLIRLLLKTVININLNSPGISQLGAVKFQSSDRNSL